jgi:hypothetical protein
MKAISQMVETALMRMKTIIYKKPGFIFFIFKYLMFELIISAY